MKRPYLLLSVPFLLSCGGNKNEVSITKLNVSLPSMAFKVNSKIEKSDFTVSAVYSDNTQKGISDFDVAEFNGATSYTFTQDDFINRTKTFNISYLSTTSQITVSVYQSSDKEVSEDVWNEAIEYLVNYKKNYDLSYVAKGNIEEIVYENNVITRSTIFSNYETNNKVEKNSSKYLLKNKQYKDLYSYSLQDDYFLYRSYSDMINSQTEEVSQYGYVSSYPIRHYFENLYNLYDNYQYFEFNNGVYIWNFVSLYGDYDYTLYITFENDKISTFSLDYINIYTNKSGKVFKKQIKGAVYFVYSSSLSKDILPSDFESKTNEEKAKHFISLDSNNSYTFSPDVLSTSLMVVNVDAGTTFNENNTLTATSSTSSSFKPFNNISSIGAVKVDENNNITSLTLGDETTPNDFYVKDTNNIIFTSPLKANEKIKMYIDRNSTSTLKNITFSFHNPN